MVGNVICDLDGVVYRGTASVPGSAAALAKFRVAGWRILFCTNNSSRTPEDVAARIFSITGFEATPEEVVTSAAAAARLLSIERPPTFVLGGDGVTQALRKREIPIAESGREARAVVVGLATGLTYGWLREASNAVRGGARFIATNHDATYPAEDGFWPGAGAIMAAVEVASGVRAEVAGKPFPPMRDLLKESLVPGPVWVVGDRPDTDLGLTEAEPGWRSALVLTGVANSGDGVEPAPDLVAADLAAVAEVLLATGN
jgi:HAD superfamily hydrolase (TIGR01450 family)